MMKLLPRVSVLIGPYCLPLLLALFIFNPACAQPDVRLTKQQWLEDLDHVTEALVAAHPNVFYRIGEDDFKMTAAKAAQQIKGSRSNEECFVAIRKVVASIQDGHTVLGAGDLPGYRDIFPVRMYEFTDGIYITGITEGFAEYIGAKVIEIGQLTADEAIDRAGSIAFADNEFYRKEQAPLIVITCKLAYGLGITRTIDELPLVVETEDAGRETIVLSPITLPGANNMLRGMDIGPEGVSFASAFTHTEKKPPAYIRHLDGNHNYWFDHYKGRRAIYMQFNLVADEQDESFEEFYTRMFGYIDDNVESVDRFILDLRFNNGGSGPILLPFMNEIIKRDRINRLGRLYILIGRRSFSAAVLLVAEMMSHTRALLVGEPTGAAQNTFSDMVFLGMLPNSGATLLVSSAYFNIAWPGNRNYMIPPHYPAPFSSSDFFSGKDPALEAIFAGRVRALETVFREQGPEAALGYFGDIRCDWGAHRDELCITPSTFPISTKYKGESQMTNAGYGLMNQGKMDEARAVFELNVNLFPKSWNAWDSYAEYFMRTGNNSTAIEYYSKSLDLNPDNQNAAEMIRRLRRQSLNEQ
jgi:tetratricopeptide (TPR) repeat protein